MLRQMQSSLIRILIITVLTAANSNFMFAQNQNWTAPDAASEKINPLAGNVYASDKGKVLFDKVCATCHGKSGAGDGPAAKALKPVPADLGSDGVQGQKDGAIFWKISEGKGTMAAYKASLTTTQRWQLVNYIRTLQIKANE